MSDEPGIYVLDTSAWLALIGEEVAAVKLPYTVGT